MTLKQLVDNLSEQALEIMKGAKALSDLFEEKKNAGTLKPGEAREWRTAIGANVKKAQELQKDVDNLKKLLG